MKDGNGTASASSLEWKAHLFDVNGPSANCSKAMCWVLVVMHHRAALLSAPTGETISGTSEALGQTMVPKRECSSPGLGTQLVPKASR